jgi:DNA-binding MarR family transcriptional regulator
VRTAAVLSDAFEQVFKPAGITGAQYNVLRILRGAEPDGLCRNELRDRMVTRMPDVTRLLDRMEAAGLVTRERDTDDRRLVTTRITARGRRLVDGLDDAVLKEHRRRLGHLEAGQLKALTELLTLVRQSG